MPARPLRNRLTTLNEASPNSIEFGMGDVVLRVGRHLVIGSDGVARPDYKYGRAVAANYPYQPCRRLNIYLMNMHFRR
jgi:hypothetical protein